MVMTVFLFSFAAFLYGGRRKGGGALQVTIMERCSEDR